MNEEKEFIKLYEKTYPVISRYVIVKCDNLSNVEDIVQNVYIKVYQIILKKGIDYFNNSIPIILKLCKNELFKYYSLKEKIKYILYDEKVNYQIENIPCHSNIENDFELKLTIEDAWNIIKKEDIITQKIAALYFYSDLKIIDISKFLKINTNTIKSKLYRLINKLKKWGIDYEK